jgi:hypothetical protein
MAAMMLRALLIILVVVIIAFAAVTLMPPPERYIPPGLGDTGMFSGRRLHADVMKYASFGEHRTGTTADLKTSEWIAGELRAAGFRASFQEFTTEQYILHEARLEAGADRVRLFPQWWPPRDKAGFSLTGLLVDEDDEDSYRGNIVLVNLSVGATGDVKAGARKIIGRIAKNGAAAILAVSGHSTGEPCAGNVRRDDPPWPVPVLLAGRKDAGVFSRAIKGRGSVTITVKGEYRDAARTRNVIGTLVKGGRGTVVVTTPLTGWFTCGAERGPGVALFLALARWAARNAADTDFIFAATTGHEIGKGGMEHFIEKTAPKPGAVKCWVHLGASIAARRENSERPEKYRKFFLFSPSNYRLFIDHFRGLGFIPFPGIVKLVGEMENVRVHGYANYFGMAGRHRSFHTPADTGAAVSPEVLEPPALATVQALGGIIKGPGRR